MSSFEAMGIPSAASVGKVKCSGGGGISRGTIGMRPKNVLRHL
jgi:hypothetical protein